MARPDPVRHGAAAAVAMALPLLVSAPAARAEVVVRETRLAMGTQVTVTLAGVEPEEAHRAFAAAFEVFARVDEVMRTGAAVRVFADREPVRKVLVTAEGERRTGAVMLIDDAGRLTGLFTDSDLARLLARRGEHELDRPVSAVMTRSPITVGEAVSVGDAVSLLKGRKLSELPVVDAAGRPVGLVDITDLIGLT